MWIQLYYINNCVTFPGKAVWPHFHEWHLTAIEKLTKVPVFHQLKCGASTELNVYLSVTRDVAVISIVSLQRQTAKSFVNLLHQAPVEKVMIPRVYSRVRLGLFQTFMHQTGYCLRQMEPFLINEIIEQSQQDFEITLGNLCQILPFFVQIKPIWQLFHAPACNDMANMSRYCACKRAKIRIFFVEDCQTLQDYFKIMQHLIQVLIIRDHLES